ncbi:MAG TPA: Ada metal-binding domain-containing protein [Longimicrobiaceae bacterium]|nr:Ada metal-binding domain-containing protein [Longimicrobiaceae bacterium]
MLQRFYARDRSSDGRFLTGVLTTGIYCLPSCTARKPRPENVRFFQTQEEARSAGLRPCRRCRPDDFYRAYDPDLHLVETLAADVRRRPGAFADAAAMTAASGIGTTKLSALFRRHWHTTPAAFLARERVAAACRLLADDAAGLTDTAFAVGFESLSAFHDNFRRLTGLTPGDYRRLGASAEFVLALPDDYLAAHVLLHFGRDAASPTERVRGTELAKALRLDGVPARLVVRLEAGAARCRVEAERPVSPEAMRAAHAAAVRILGLGSDAPGFERHLARRPDLARLLEGRRGLRIPLTADAFEGLVWVIVGQQVNLAFAYALRRELIERCGEPAGGGMRTHPTAEAVAALDYADLTARRFSRRKAEYVVDTARLAARGELLPDLLAEGPATRAEQALLAVRGLGPWSVHYFLMRACGFADCVPLGDAGLTTALARFFGLGHRPGVEETAALMEPFAPFRSLATFHLWTTLGDPQ